MIPAMDIKIDGVRIKQPHECSSSKFNLTKSGRTLKGFMKMDLVGKKRKLEFKYSVLSGKDFDAILHLIDDPKKMFFTVTWKENTTSHSAKMYVGEIQVNKFRSDQGAWYWKDISFDFIEQ